MSAGVKLVLPALIGTVFIASDLKVYDNVSALQNQVHVIR